MRSVVVWVGLGVALMRDPGGCGGGEVPLSGSNAPCTRNRDCEGSLVCTAGVCADGVGDASADAEASRDAWRDGDGDADRDGPTEPAPRDGGEDGS